MDVNVVIKYDNGIEDRLYPFYHMQGERKGWYEVMRKYGSSPEYVNTGFFGGSIFSVMDNYMTSIARNFKACGMHSRDMAVQIAQKEWRDMHADAVADKVIQLNLALEIALDNFGAERFNEIIANFKEDKGIK